MRFEVLGSMTGILYLCDRTTSITLARNNISPLENARKSLICGHFSPVDSLTAMDVPDSPGLYCIRLKDKVKFPTNYGQLRRDRIIYIGQASTSLRKRLWEQELNHKSAATFFRSIGAILGYLPPAGSLYGKKTRNYKFSPEDTERIRKWTKKSLEVSFVEFDTAHMDDVEKALIGEYMPLVNIEHNPGASDALKAARNACVYHAQKPVSDGPFTNNFDPYFFSEYEKALAEDELRKKRNKEAEVKPWYKDINAWAWIVTGVCILAIIVIMVMDSVDEKRAKANQHRPRSYEEIFTPEEQQKMGIGGHIDGPGDWKPDPNTAQKAREFIEKGGNADPRLDAIQDGDYHDLLDQMGGPEGF